MSYIVNITIIILFLAIQAQLIDSSRILLLIPLTTVSEKNLYIPLANALGNRGHNVTVAARFKSNYESNNVNEVIIFDSEDYLSLYSDPMEMRRERFQQIINMEYDFNVEGCESVFKNKNFHKLRKEKFDLVFINFWFEHCLLGFIYEQQAPFITVSTMPLWPYTQSMTGLRNPTSFVPNPLLSVRDDMSFGERMFNTLFDHYLNIYFHWVYVPALEGVYKKYLGSHLPNAMEIERNLSLIFSNTHISFTVPIPMLPNVIEIGGVHCRPPKPLPKDLNDYLNGSGEDGFIFFSLGSVIQGKSMSDEWRKIFLNVFSRLKQKVLWKWETEHMEDLSANVKLGKWFPQQDILGHPKMKLFISHGGMFSTQEAVYHGVPVLGIPIFVDQDMNSHHMEANGCGKKIEFLELTEEKLENTIHELLINKSYLENAKRQSFLFRDQLQTPMERAVYWTEYVIQHNGAHHLRSAARDLNFFQYHSLDIIGVLCLIILFTLYLIFIISRILLKRFYTQRKKATEKTNKKKQKLKKM